MLWKYSRRWEIDCKPVTLTKIFAWWCCFHVLQQPQIFGKTPPLLTSKGWRLARECGRRDTPRDGVRADAGCSAAGMLVGVRADRRAEAPSMYEPTHPTAASKMPVAAAPADRVEASNSAVWIFVLFRACLFLLSFCLTHFAKKIIMTDVSLCNFVHKF